VLLLVRKVLFHVQAQLGHGCGELGHSSFLGVRLQEWFDHIFPPVFGHRLPLFKGKCANGIRVNWLKLEVNLLLLVRAP
jgi:hypothetical protein